MNVHYKYLDTMLLLDLPFSQEEVTPTLAPSRTGNIRPRGNRWQARLQRADRSTTSATFATEDEAEAWIKEQSAPETPSAPSAPSATPTLREYATTYVAESTSYLKPSSRQRVVSGLRGNILPALGDLRLDQIRPADVRRWANAQLEDAAPATVLRNLRTLTKVLQQAADDGVIDSNPARGVKGPRIDRPEQRWINTVEVATLSDTIDHRYRALILLAAYGGLRIGELTGLTVKRVNPLRGTVTVAEQIVEVAGHLEPGQPKTRAGRRTVPIPRLVMESLEPHLAGRGVDDLVFTGPQGGPLRRTLWNKRFFQPAVQRAGLAPLRVHDLRHTAVALWVQAGASPLETARRAGHARTATILDLYGHISPDGFEATTARLEEMARDAAANTAGTT